jgi:hypothetical protein
VRRTPVSERPDDSMDDERPESASIRRISTAPADQRAISGGATRYRRSGRWSQPRPSRRGPGMLAWLLRAILGLGTLAAIWVGLLWLFPMAQPREAENPLLLEPPIATQVGAPEPPPAAVAPSAPAEPAPTRVPTPTTEEQGDRLPGLAPPSAASAPPPEAPAAPAESEESAPDESATPAEQAQVGPPTLAPIPPPGAPTTAGAPRSQAAPLPAQTKPTPPPAPAGASGTLQLRATASPANPVSENAIVTIGLNLTANGAPVSGAQCIATVYFRTATVRQPAGGVTTGPGGAASFQLDAKGATFNRYVPVDVTCTSRQGSVTARTGFTPVRGR